MVAMEAVVFPTEFPLLSFPSGIEVHEEHGKHEWRSESV